MTEREAAAASARDAFEKWARSRIPADTWDYGKGPNSTAYYDVSVHWAWCAWQADRAPQAVRMLTEAEAKDCLEWTLLMSEVEAIQRKFCEVNGLRIGEKAVRRPLTEEQIDALYEANCEPRNPYAPSRKFFGRTVRAAEFAHGIVPLAPQDRENAT